MMVVICLLVLIISTILCIVIYAMHSKKKEREALFTGKIIELPLEES